MSYLITPTGRKPIYEAKYEVQTNQDIASNSGEGAAITYGRKKGYKEVGMIATRKNPSSYMVLFDLHSSDKSDVKDIKLKSGEKIYRYATRQTMSGGIMPYIKVNVNKGLAYYLDQESSEGKTDEVKFESTGEKLQFARMVGNSQNEEVELGEGLVDWVSRKMGKSWGKVGDRVRGSTVAAYLRSNTYFSDQVLKKLARYTYQLKTISLADAQKYREFSDANASDDIMDPMKLDRARGRNITKDSLIKNPPVVDRDGYIWDGNHRMARAIELRMNQIPVLMQVSKAPMTEAFELDEAKKEKGFIGNSDGRSWAVNINGIKGGNKPTNLGWQVDNRKVIDDFKKSAKKTHAGAKGKSTIPAVKKHLKMLDATEYFAVWKSDSNNYKDDSVEIWYKTDGVNEELKLDEATNVTDYNPKSQGGTRKELLAKIKNAKGEERSALVSAARKAGATQMELQRAMKEESEIDETESFELDELKKSTYLSYSDKSSKDIDKRYGKAETEKEKQKLANRIRGYARANVSSWTAKEELDQINKDALKKKFKNRKDKDIDNDGDTDSSDEYLHNRRQKISKAMED